MTFDIVKASNVFVDFYQQLAEAKKINKQTVFDYESKKGNKDARSYIYKLRQSKSAVETKRKEAKDDALKFGQALDAEAKKITAEIEDMIDVHEKPLKEIEEREKARISKINDMIDYIASAGSDESLSSFELQSFYDSIFSLDINEDYAEFKEKALVAKDATLKRLVNCIQSAKKYEAEQAELERLRREDAERIQKEREAEIARAAKEQAEQKAKAEQKRLEREKLEAEARAKESERQRIAAVERAKIEAGQAKERERIAVERARQEQIMRQNSEQAKIKAEREAREANEIHVNNIHEQSKQSFMSFGLNSEQAEFNVYLISSGQIKNVSINY